MTRRALITGGSSPIGAAIAEEAGALGFEVIVHANRNLDAAEATAETIRSAGGRAEALALDLSDPEAPARLAAMAEAETIHALVHCVGGQRDMPFAAMTTADWREIVDLNLHSFFTALRPLILPMMRARWGRIVALSSLTAVTGNRGQSNYAAAKGGLLPLVKSLSREYGRRGITANVIAPGVVDTPEIRRLDNFDALVAMSSVGRAGRVDEVAALAGFLLSDKSGYITGQQISMDGGTT